VIKKEKYLDSELIEIH